MAKKKPAEKEPEKAPEVKPFEHVIDLSTQRMKLELVLLLTKRILDPTFDMTAGHMADVCHALDVQVKFGLEKVVEA